MQKISVIVPCYNMVSYIEQTLKSIISQNYNNLELIIVDGGSSDGTIDILNRYKENFTHYISEPDHGQYDAITKGFSLASGEILCWLNADDYFFPWTLISVARLFNENKKIDWIRGIPAFMDEDGCLTNIYNNISSAPQKFIKNGWFSEDLFGFLQQESMFWKRSLWEKVNGLNLKYTLAADFELWTRFAENSELVSFGLPLAAFRKRSDSRSAMQKQYYLDEVTQICSSKHKYNYLIRIFAKYSNYTNFITRLITWRKVPIYYYSVKMKKWIFQYRIRPVSNISLTQLLLENSINTK